MTVKLDYFEKLRARVEMRLGELVPTAVSADPLKGAFRHSLLAPAKRVRALLMMITARELGGREENALDLACSLEMIHAASLILDDLPAMDDAETRRGLPPNHRGFRGATRSPGAHRFVHSAHGRAG